MLEMDRARGVRVGEKGLKAVKKDLRKLFCEFKVTAMDKERQKELGGEAEGEGQYERVT